MTEQRGRLDGKVALITGAARGQGRAHALRLANDGANIVAVDVCAPVLDGVGYQPATPEDLADTARQVEATGRSVIARQADVRQQDALDAAVTEALDRFGRIDIVVANAGVAQYVRSWELSEDDFRTMIDVNLIGAWRTAKAAIPAMIAAENGGSIVFISSTAGLRGIPMLSHYSAAKHGLVGLMRTLAQELGPYMIRVNTVHPGAIETVMGLDPDVPERVVPDPLYGQYYRTSKPMPIGLLAPEDISAAVAWLVSDEARYVTGIAVPVDGGSSVR